MKMGSTIDILIRKKPAKLMALLSNKDRKWYTANLAKESGMTYAYTKRIIEQLEKNGLVSIERVGKYSVVIPTQEGLRIAGILTELFEMIKSEDSGNR